VNKTTVFVIILAIVMSTSTVIGLRQPQTAAEAQGQQSSCPQLTSDPYTNDLLCKARAIGGVTDPRSDPTKDKQWNPPHNWPQIREVCARQAEAKGYGYSGQLVDQYCVPILENCISFRFTFEECYGFSFVALGTPIPVDIQNGISMKIKGANDRIDPTYRQQLCPDKAGNYGDYCPWKPY
jgi:hypothetical protein